MTQPLISLKIYYKIILAQLVFVVYLLSTRILVNNLKDKHIRKIFTKLFVSIALLVIYSCMILSNITLIGLNADGLRLLIAGIFITVLIVRMIQNWQQASYILRSIFEDKALSKKILNYSGLKITNFGQKDLDPSRWMM